MKITIKKLSEQVVSADDIRKRGLTAHDIKKRIQSSTDSKERTGPPAVGSEEWKAAEKKIGHVSDTGLDAASEEKIIKAIRIALTDPEIVDMIKKTLEKHLGATPPAGSEEETLPGNRPLKLQ